jgi:curved DNA-binding protein CbpA
MDDYYKLDDYLTVLAINGYCDAGILKNKYRSLIKIYHPDKHYNDKKVMEEATEKCIEINNAYEYLSEYIELNGPIDQSIESDYDYYEVRHIHDKVEFSPGFPDPHVFEYFVKSSAMLSCGYSMSNRYLYIKFRHSVVYRYYNVPQNVFFDLLNSKSHGKFSHRFIYKNYKYERCKEPNVPYNGPDYYIDN